MANHVKQLPPTSDKFAPRKGMTLPNLAFHESPNRSQRLHGMIPWLIIAHRPVGEYKPSRDWLSNPRSRASAHVITEGHGTGVDVATQLVPWDQKAWAAAIFNSPSYNLEVDDDGWDGDDWGAFYTGAHIAAFICHKTGIPPVWTHAPMHMAGLTRHLDLGKAGGGHTDPTHNLTVWENFIRQVHHDVKHTQFRKTYGHGFFHHIHKLTV